MVMAPSRRKSIFNSKLQKKYPQMKKGRTESDARCDLSDSTINIANAGKSEIDKHLESVKHKKAMSARSKSRTVTSFFTSSQMKIKNKKARAFLLLRSTPTLRHVKPFGRTMSSKRIIASFDRAALPKYFAHASKCVSSIERAPNAKRL